MAGAIQVAGRPLGGRQPFFILGPCVIESLDLCLSVADRLAELARRLKVEVIFKSSFDKANRTSGASFRGPGLEEGLRVLERVREASGLPIISDIHTPHQATAAGEVLDVIQIPAFLCRQTDLLTAAGRTGKPVNIKKGQFMSPEEMAHPAAKVAAAGNGGIMLTERGTSFGYHDLVVDMRSLPALAALGYPVVFDATHSVQQPGGQGSCSGGQSRFSAPLARAAVAVGVDGLFMEVHPNPKEALCDGPNSLPLDDLEGLIVQLLRLSQVLA